MYDLTSFTLQDMVECGLALRQMGDDATSMEQTSQRIVKYIYENLVERQTGERSCALVRFFKTHPYGELELQLKEYARGRLGEDNPSPVMKCLTLLASAGEQPQWNNRGASVGHKAIPLKSEDLVAQTPMISQLIRQFGLDISTVLQPDPDLLLELEQKTFNVFYVADAIASPYISAQDSFVIPHGIKSVLGCGALLPSGNLFATILFLKIPIPFTTAEMFNTLALNIKAAVLPFDGQAIFQELLMPNTKMEETLPKIEPLILNSLKSQTATLSQLLEVSEKSTLKQSARLESTITQLKHEIVERLRAEASLSQKNDEIASTLKELQATQSQLILSEKMAALGQVIAGVAHEINTPLGAIRSSVESMANFLAHTLEELPHILLSLPTEVRDAFLKLLQRALKKKSTFSSREERQMKRALISELESKNILYHTIIADTLVDLGIYNQIDEFMPLLTAPNVLSILETAYKISGLGRGIQTINTATDKAAKIVFALKSYARQDQSGTKQLSDLVDGIETALMLYYNQIKKGVQVTKNYCELPLFLCYPDELNQVWTNLIHNALQAMDNRGNLTIDIAQINETIKISITDSGPGIPVENQAKIFEPFFTTKPAGEGTGLGLSIVKTIVDKHRGNIALESQPGQTTFHIVLPIQSSEDINNG